MNWLADYAPTIGLIFFFITFLWIAVNAYRPRAKRRLDGYAHIPLNEEKPRHDA